MWRVTPLKRWSNSSSELVTRDKGLTSSSASPLSAGVPLTLKPPFWVCITSTTMTPNYLSLHGGAARKKIFLDKMSHSSRSAVTRDNCRKPWKLWCVTLSKTRFLHYCTISTKCSEILLAEEADKLCFDLWRILKTSDFLTVTRYMDTWYSSQILV